jgi:ABC-2 type transport system ATP-binding protein
MIEAKQLSKRFGNITAVDSIDATIREGQVFGLLGTNGAGKSTFLRLAAGVFKPDAGSIAVDGVPIFEQVAAKRKLFYISDDIYYFTNCNPEELGDYYARHYADFDRALYNKLLHAFNLDPKRKINTFSKGMKRQTSLFAGLAAHTPYLLCDETFDGLDPVVRQAVKSLFADGIASRGLTPVIASHNLRELEDICDHIGLLHKGGMLLSRDLDDMKLNLHKVQAAFDTVYEAKDFPGLDIVTLRKSGKLLTMVVRGGEGHVMQALREKQPIFSELLPLTLEEVFISETEVAGYDFHELSL